jgi:hypothetical protein
MEVKNSGVPAPDTPGASEAADIDIDKFLETIVTPWRRSTHQMHLRHYPAASICE